MRCVCVWSVCVSSEYYETLQCLYDSLLKCSVDQSHLYIIASRLGHLRTFMEQTCAASSPAARTTTMTPGVDRHTADVTSRRRDAGDTSHVTTLTPTTGKSMTVAVTRQADKYVWGDEDASGSSSPKYSAVTKPAGRTPPPKSLSLHSCAVSSTTRSAAVFIFLVSAVISALLRRRLCPT